MASYDTSYQRLLFHRIDVIRGGHRSSRLSLDPIQLLRRETSLETQVLDGTLTATVVMQDVRPGDRIDVAYTVQGFNPALGGRYDDDFTGGWSHPVGRARVRILAPIGRPLRFAAHGGALKPAGTVRGLTVEHLWESADTPAVLAEDLTPSWHVAVPWLQVSEFRGWEEVGRWALSLFPPAELPHELQAPVVSWLERYTSAEERALAAVDWVQRSIRYVGIELGIGSYQPGSPATVASRRFGDCKDQVHLLCALLERMGIEAAPVLVSSWARKLVAQLLPSPRVFDHAIARVLLGGRPVLVDPTCSSQRGPLAERFVPDYGYGLLIAEGQRELLPVSPHQGVAPESEIVERLRAGGRGESAEMTVQTTARGGAADDLRWQFASSRLEEIATSYLNYYASRYPGIQSAGELVFEDDETANVFRVTERYRLPQFWIEQDGGARAELLADAIINVIPRSQTRVRTSPLWVDFPRRVVQRMEVELPEEWPEDSETETFSNAAFQVRVEHRVSGRSVTIHYEYRSLAAEVPVEQVPGVQESVRELDPSLSFEITWGAGRREGLSPVVLAAGLAVVAAAAAAAVLAYLHMARRAQALPGSAPPGEVVPMAGVGEEALRGLGGWLVPVAIGLCLRPLQSVLGLVQMAPALSADTWSLLTDPSGVAYHPMWAPMLLFEVATNVIFAVASVLLLVLFFQRRRQFPRAFMALLAAQVAVTFVDLVGAGMLPSAQTGSSVQQIRLAVFTLTSSVVWILYMLRSRRVRLTFVR